MVKGYNPEKSDKVKSIWDKILSPISDLDKHIPIKVAQKWIYTWFSDPMYNHIFNAFRQRGVPPPTIKLKRSCQQEDFDSRLNVFSPVAWMPQCNVIGVCLSEMQNKVELKQSLNRELNMSYKYLTESRDHSKDQNIILTLYDCCYDSLGDLHMPKDLQTAIAKKCAKTNFYFRFFRRDKFPIDQQYKYIHKLIQELIP